MKLVLLDSSFLLTMLRRGEELDGVRRNLTGPMRFVTIDRVVYELQRMARSGSSRAAGLARVALGQLERLSIPIIDTVFGVGDVDTAIVATVLAERTAVLVATADRKLRETLSKQGVSTISPLKGRRE